MVPLIDRWAYLSTLLESPKVRVFFEFIFNKSIDEHIEFGVRIDQVYYECIGAILNDQKDLFEKHYNSLGKRNLSSDSYFIYDNYLTFVLACGVRKFALEIEHVLRFLEYRNSTNEIEGKITNAFKNIVLKNTGIVDSYSAISIVAQEVVSEKWFTSEQVKKAYNELVKKSDHEHDFLVLFELRAFDWIIQNLEVSTENINLRSFESSFIKRVQQLGKWLYFLICIIIIVIAFICYLKVESLRPFFDNIDVVSGVLGALGLGGIANEILNKKKISKWIAYKISFFFGYKEIENI